MYDVITIGSNTVDAFVKTSAEVRKVEHLEKRGGTIHKTTEESIIYPVGDKILIDHLEFKTGGGGTNCAVNFALQGLKTAYLGKIGNDSNGDKILHELQSKNIDFLGSKGQITGFSVVLDSISDDRTILNYKGCSNDLDISEIDKKTLQAKWIYLSSMMGQSYVAAEKIISQTKSKVAFNPSLYQAKLGIDKLKHILKKTDALILNKEEILALTNQADLSKALVIAKNNIKGEVIVTNASKGAIHFDGKNLHKIAPNPKLKIVETTGAGDAFASTYVTATIKKYDLTTRLLLASTQAENVIGGYGAKETLKRLDTKHNQTVKNKKRIQKITLKEV